MAICPFEEHVRMNTVTVINCFTTTETNEGVWSIMKNKTKKKQDQFGKTNMFGNKGYSLIQLESLQLYKSVVTEASQCATQFKRVIMSLKEYPNTC